MKAVVIQQFGGPEVLEYVDIPKPEPKAGEVLVRNIRIGAGKPDCLVRSGNAYFDVTSQNITMGFECSGYVEKVGEGVDSCKVGDAVVVFHAKGYGAYAEYICVDEKYVTVLPEHIKPENATGLTNFYVAYALLHEAGRGTDGKSLYIPGAAGGIGIALTKIALADGFEVIVSASTEEKCEHLRKVGATHVFNYKECDAVEAIQGFTNNRGVDLVFDQLVGNKFFDEFEVLAPFGMVVVYNWMQGTPGEDFYPHLVKNAIKSYAVRSFSFHIYDDKPDRITKIREHVFELLEKGQITMEHYYGTCLPLSEARRMHEMLEAGDTIGKCNLFI